MSEHGSSARAILYAFLANFGIALAKSWAAFHTRSGSLLAEAIHSYADCGNQILLYIGLRQARRPADLEHPMGYGKISYFWSFLVAIMLFSMGGLFSIYEGVHKLGNTEPLNQPWIGLWVLGFAIVLESFSLFGALREIRKIRGEKTLSRWLKTTRSSELVVILGEDFAALVGLAFAFVFVGLAVFTGNAVWDAIGSIVIGVVLITVSVFVALRIKMLIVGRSAEPELQQIIEKIIVDEPGIEALLNTITLQFGTHIMLAAKLKMRPGIPIEQAVEQINDLEVKIKTKVPDVAWCFMEPDIRD